MKTIKHTLLILLLAVCITSCASDEAVNEKISSEMLQKGTDSAKKAVEANSTSGYDNINVDVDDVKYVWQKNLLWFLTRHITQ